MHEQVKLARDRAYQAEAEAREIKPNEALLKEVERLQQDNTALRRSRLEPSLEESSWEGSFQD